MHLALLLVLLSLLMLMLMLMLLLLLLLLPTDNNRLDTNLVPPSLPPLSHARARLLTQQLQSRYLR